MRNGLTAMKFFLNGEAEAFIHIKVISDQFEISIFTVNTHRQRILKKLNANNTTEAILYASRLGLIS
jgi:DNA-binding NarL/FixJ family response regulator